MQINVNGARVYAYTGSRGFDPARPTIGFVHGAAHDHSVWALQSRYFAHHRRNVLAVDLPGHGRSGGEPPASVEAIGEWLTALLDVTRIEQAALVGHSLGALAVLEAAGRHPERVETIALLGRDPSRLRAQPHDRSARRGSRRAARISVRSILS